MLTNENFAVGAACYLNLRCIVKQINPAWSMFSTMCCTDIAHTAEARSAKALTCSQSDS